MAVASLLILLVMMMMRLIWVVGDNESDRVLALGDQGSVEVTF